MSETDTLAKGSVEKLEAEPFILCSIIFSFFDRSKSGGSSGSLRGDSGGGFGGGSSGGGGAGGGF